MTRPAQSKSSFNLDDARLRYQADINAAYAAVRDGFPHLGVRDIVSPPHGWFDAALARQIVLHLMVHQFQWPKRRIVETEDRSREAVNRALRTIEERRLSPRFASHYDRITSAARLYRATEAFVFGDEEAA